MKKLTICILIVNNLTFNFSANKIFGLLNVLTIFYFILNLLIPVSYIKEIKTLRLICNNSITNSNENFEYIKTNNRISVNSGSTNLSNPSQ